MDTYIAYVSSTATLCTWTCRLPMDLFGFLGW